MSSPTRQPAAPASDRSASDGDDTGAESDRQVVEVDALFQELIPLFMESRRADVGRLLDAAARGDLKTAGAVAHSLCGVGGSLGFPVVTRLGREMEDAIRQGDLTRLRTLTLRLGRYIDRVEVVFVEV